MSTKQQRDPYSARRTTPFTNKEMEVMCDVTPMSVFNWRQGSPTREPLRTAKTQGRDVRFPVRSTLAWLKRYSIPIAVHPDDLTEPSSVPAKTAAKRPGPKPRALAVAQTLASERPSSR